VALPDWSLPACAGRLAVVRGTDRTLTLLKAVDQLGGIRAFVRAGDRVALKVNAAFASPPVLAATTHPDLVRDMARLCFEAGAASVIVLDNPISDPVAAFERSGLAGAARACGARLVLPSAEAFAPVALELGGSRQPWPMLVQPLLGVDRLIALSPVKDHACSGASLTLKGWMGLLGGDRGRLHQDLHRAIAELARVVRPTLVVLDGTVSMVRNGPTGGSLADLEPTGTLIVGTDPVAVDAAGARLLGRSPQDLPFLALAEAAGAGQVMPAGPGPDGTPDPGVAP
jgi:uncharacterized protein (DUF362 family)